MITRDFSDNSVIGASKVGYQNLLVRIAEPIDDYYNVLIEHAADIINMIDRKGQVKVAEDLRVSQAKLSALSKLLEEISNNKRYWVYYVIYNNGESKIGYSTNVAQRLLRLGSKLGQSDTCRYTSIRTFAFYDEQEARNAEALIKGKYKEYTLPDSTEHFNQDVLNAADLNTLYKLSIEG